jgi:hypothetical protein
LWNDSGNITEIMVNAEPQEIITSDKLNASVDAQVYFKVKSDEENVKNSQYAVNNYKYQIVNLARTTLRNIIGTMTLKTANSERGLINSELQKTLRNETGHWGNRHRQNRNEAYAPAGTRAPRRSSATNSTARLRFFRPAAGRRASAGRSLGITQSYITFTAHLWRLVPRATMLSIWGSLPQRDNDLRCLAQNGGVPLTALERRQRQLDAFIKIMQARM